MSEASRPILAEVALFGRNLRNRLAVAPMSRVNATDDGLGARPTTPAPRGAQECSLRFQSQEIKRPAPRRPHQAPTGRRNLAAVFTTHGLPNGTPFVSSRRAPGVAFWLAPGYSAPPPQPSASEVTAT